MNPLQLTISDTFTKELPADPIEKNYVRQVRGACFSYVAPSPPSAPQLVHISPEVAEMIGLTEEAGQSEYFLKVFSGTEVLEGTRPYAMCYGGHQFGHWSGQLGDGRAINLAEVEHEGKRWALQLKGAGRTPYSRGADGLAVLRSSIREHLCSEAMHHLGVPTSRSLSLVLTGDQVLRDVMYDGNPGHEKGAIVTRVAQSFLRFGSFEIHIANQDIETLRTLTDYTIKHYYPEVTGSGKEKYGQFFHEVCQRSLKMVMHWQRVGFVHGVMNTDNLSITGDTIDYGPYGWLEGYDPNWTPNTTDAQNRRYRYGQQPAIVYWNLHKLANALYPLVEDAAPFEQALKTFQADFQVQYTQMFLQKLGLSNTQPDDEALIESLESCLQLTETDMTIFFRNLANFTKSQPLAEGNQFLDPVKDAFYDPDALTEVVVGKWRNWFTRYLNRLDEEIRPDAARKAAMNQVNPKYVLRNYMAQLAIDAADNGDFSIVSELYELLKQPYAEQPKQEKWFAKRPEWARHKVGCSMLSCSS